MDRHTRSIATNQVSRTVTVKEVCEHKRGEGYSRGLETVCKYHTDGRDDDNLRSSGLMSEGKHDSCDEGLARPKPKRWVKYRKVQDPTIEPYSMGR